jgi:hypothetical protein
MPRRSVTPWAWALAERHLARDMPRRWAHVQGVAWRAGRVGRTLLTPKDQEMLAAFPDERTALRDALWYSDMRTSGSGAVLGSYLVRALDSGGLAARLDAVRRTELRLSGAGQVLAGSSS